MSYNERFIYMMREFSDELANAVVKQLFELDNKDQRDTLLVINSDGGDVSALFAIHDAMRMVRSNVATLCLGRAYSSAAYLLIAGAKGKRFITPTSDIMFHEISSEVEGKLSTLKDELVSIEHYDRMVHKIAAAALKIPYKKALKRRHEVYYDAEEALKIGAIDHIVTSISDVSKHLDIKL